MACECIAKVNAALKGKNTTLVSVLTGMGTDTVRERVTLRVEKLEARGAKVTNVIAAHCPACGVKY